jgi:hypothetical protein
VSQTYVWLIEQSKPRKSGEPSRPGEDLLRRWMAALGMDASDAQRIRDLAGYFGEDAQYVSEVPPRSSARTSMRSVSTEKCASTPDESGQDLGQSSGPVGYGRDASMAALQRWAGSDRLDVGDEAIVERLRLILQRATENGQSGEVRALLNSFLAWLQFHADREL